MSQDGTINYDELGVDVGALADYVNTQKREGTIFWSPEKGDNIVRILPPHPLRNPGMTQFFQVCSFHDIDGKRHLCREAILKEPCPVCEMRRRVYQTAQRAGRGLQPQEEQFAKMCGTRKRYMCNVVVRGQEDKGVRVWEFGGKMLEKLGKLMASPHFGDITKVKDGRDVVVVRADKAIEEGRTLPNYDQSYIIPNATPLGTTEQIHQWMESQHKLAELVVPKVMGFEELFKAAFNMTPEDAVRLFGGKTGGETRRETIESIFGTGQGTDAPKPASKPAEKPAEKPAQAAETVKPDPKPDASGTAAPADPDDSAGDEDASALADYAAPADDRHDEAPAEQVGPEAMSTEQLLAELAKRKK